MIRPPIKKFFIRNLSFDFFKNWGRTCDKVECTKPMQMPEKYVIEKYCGPSIFEAWKPKKPDLSCLPTIKSELLRKYTPKECKAGMKTSGESRCRIDAEAKQCQKINHPKWLKHCPPQPKNNTDGPQTIFKAALIKCRKNKDNQAKDKTAAATKPSTKSSRKKCTPQVPHADWNHDGYLG